MNPPDIASLIADQPLPRVAELRAMQVASALPGERILALTLGRAQAALALARQRPDASVHGWFLDLYHWRLAMETLAAPANLQLTCSPDLPEGRVDLAIIPNSKQGEAELTRELLQQAHQRLAIGGRLVAAVDNARDRWLREQISGLLPKVTVHQFDDAVVYTGRKQAELRKVRDFRCEFMFRDRGRALRGASRPGVFAHRRLDAGARQLIDAAEVTTGMRVLDVGCGAGTVSLALAARDPSVSVHAVDGNARAVQCTLAGAALNGLSNITAELNCDGQYVGAGEYRLAVANPPYYADNRIAELFVDAAHRSLQPGGQLLIVAKRADWYVAAMPETWDEVEHWQSKNYAIVSAIRPND